MKLTVALRDEALSKFRQKVWETLEFIPYEHQASYTAASDGYVLTDQPAASGDLSMTVRLPDSRVERRKLMVRPGGRARVIADLGSFKIGKSYGAAMWLTGFAAIPNARVQIVGLEYDTCAPEFEYLMTALLSEYPRGMNMKADKAINSPREGRMYIEMRGGARFEARSWERKDTLKGKEIDAYCMPGDAPVWMGDFTNKPIRDVSVGDEVIGWRRSENGDRYRGGVKSHTSSQKRRGDRLVRTRVLAVHHKTDTLLTIRLDSGRVLQCTGDHQWLVGNGQEGVSYQWQRADKLHIGSRVAVVDIDDPGECPPGLAPQAGWLAGIYDGEGSREGIAQSRAHNGAVLDRAAGAFRALGFDTIEVPVRDGMACLRWRGGRSAALRFVRWVPSVRFRQKYADSMILGGRFRKMERVVGIESSGDKVPAYCITTETGNFVAYGACSHNCYAEAYQLPGIECYTAFSQNLRARKGYALFPTTPDRPWVKELHERGHGGDPLFDGWHCTCGVPASANPLTFDAQQQERDKGLMTREKYAIHYLGQLGEFVGSVFGYVRGQRVCTPATHPRLWKDPNGPLTRENFKWPRHWDVLAGADTGTYYTAAFVGFAENGDAFVLDELPNYRYVAGQIETDPNITISQWSERFLDTAEAWGCKPVAYADQNSQFKREFRLHGITLLTGMPQRETRTEIAREYFQHGKVWFLPWVTVLPFEVEKAQFPEAVTGGGKYERMKRDDHTLDPLEHVLSKRPQSPPKPKKTRQRWIDQQLGGLARPKITQPADPHWGVG